MSEYLPLRVRVKLFLKKLLPTKLFELIRLLWVSSFARFVGDKDIVAKYQEIFLSRFPKEVQVGPFKGMKYVDMAVGSAYLHKLIGSYESILHPYIESLKGKQFDTVLDIGSAEGYYLVGFGKMFKDAHLVGFEIEEKGRELNQELYEKNGLNNTLTLLGEATNENITPHITDNTLLICDCEGAEVDILDPSKVPQLKNVKTAIIELHDFIRPQAKEILTERFSPTHTVTIIPFALAEPKDFPFLATITDEKDLYELRRERGWQEQEWMILERK